MIMSKYYEGALVNTTSSVDITNRDVPRIKSIHTISNHQMQRCIALIVAAAETTSALVIVDCIASTKNREHSICRRIAALYDDNSVSTDAGVLPGLCHCHIIWWKAKEAKESKVGRGEMRAKNSLAGKKSKPFPFLSGKMKMR